MRKLGQILLAKGWVTRSQLERAFANQKAVGGGLDTCLLEMNALSEERLAEALAQRYAVPAVDVETLRGVPEEVLAVVPERVASRCSAVPFAALGTVVRVAMQNPEDLGCIDELSFSVGRRVEVHVATEVRLAEALERYYKKERPSRLATLADQLNRIRYLWRERDDVKPGEGLPTLAMPRPILDAPELPTPAIDPPARSPEPPTPAESPPAPAGRPRRPPPPPSSVRLSPAESRRLGRGEQRLLTPDDLPEAFEETQRQLGGARDRDTVGRALLSLAEQLFERTALLAVFKDHVEGWMADPQADSVRFERFRAPLDRPSVFLNLKTGIPYHLGPLPDSPIHRSLLRCWDGEMPAGALLVPVRLSGRLVAVLYGDRRGEPLGQVPTDRFRTLAEHAARALERCILLKKKNLG